MKIVALISIGIVALRAAEPTLTYHRIAELSGDSFTYGAVGNWTKESTEKLDEIPQPKNIVGLAQALDLSPITVLLAAEAAGIDVSEPTRNRWPSKYHPLLTTSQQRTRGSFFSSFIPSLRRENYERADN